MVGDVVEVWFPFTGQTVGKSRPPVIILKIGGDCVGATLVVALQHNPRHTQPSFPHPIRHSGESRNPGPRLSRHATTPTHPNTTGTPPSFPRPPVTPAQAGIQAPVYLPRPPRHSHAGGNPNLALALPKLPAPKSIGNYRQSTFTIGVVG